MFVALGVIGALWIAGFAIWPDKNAPQAHAHPTAAVAQSQPSTEQPTPAAPAR